MGGYLVTSWLIGEYHPNLAIMETYSHKIFKANQIAWFFYQKILQKGFIFCIHFLYGSSKSYSSASFWFLMASGILSKMSF